MYYYEISVYQCKHLLSKIVHGGTTSIKTIIVITSSNFDKISTSHVVMNEMYRVVNTSLTESSLLLSNSEEKINII